MKKIIAFILSLVLMAACTAGISEAQTEVSDEALVGEWYLTQVIRDGIAVDLTSAADLKLTIVFSADGSAYLGTGDGNPESGTWTRNGNELVLDTDKSGITEAKIDSGKVIVERQNIIYVFEKEMHEANALPEVIPAESLSDFLGIWTISRMLANGIAMTPEQLTATGNSLEITLTILADYTTMDMIANGKPGSAVFATKFTDGTMYLSNPLTGAEIPVMYTDSGEILMTSVADGTTVQYYFAKAPENDN